MLTPLTIGEHEGNMRPSPVQCAAVAGVSLNPCMLQGRIPLSGLDPQLWTSAIQQNLITYTMSGYSGLARVGCPFACPP